MNISRIFIERPVASSVLFASILFFGWLGFRTLPVNDLPNVDFPTINVNATLPGASPEVMANTVALPLEREFSQIAGIDEMISSSTSGRTEITLTFSLARDIDSAAQDVQTAISQTIRRLPRDMDPPGLRKQNPADAPILILALASNYLPMVDLDKFADTRIAQRFASVNGVSAVNVFGSQKYAVRMYLDPNALAKRGLGMDRVVTAIQNANSNLPSGALRGRSSTYTVKSDGGLDRAADFNSLVVAYKDGNPVRVSDIGRAEDGVANERQRSWYNGDRALWVAVLRQPGSNTIEVVEQLRAMLPEIQRELPSGATLNVVTDRSEFIRQSIHDVNFTLILSIVLVVGVILVFLRNIRATLITALVLPASVVGTFAVMHLLGFSLNNLSLMAITLAVGFVVDDAIVVLENITRHMEMGKTRMQAALEGAQEISTTVLTMTISLVAVFVPILFMEGMVGRLFREFAVTVGVAVLISGAVSLSITPMLCSRLLQPTHGSHGWLFNWSERIFDATRNWYVASLRLVLRFQGTVLVASLFVLLSMGWLYDVVPKGFIPRQDTGVVNGNTRAREGIPFDEMAQNQQAVAEIVRKNENVEAVMSTAGGLNGDNVGRMVVRLKPHRTISADEVIQQLRRQTAVNQKLVLTLNNPPSIRIGGGGAILGGDYVFILNGTDLNRLYGPAQELEARLKALPILQNVQTNLQLRNPEIRLEMLRDRAAALGITSQLIETALFNAFGGRNISTLYGATDQYDVRIEVDRRYQTDINAMESIYIQAPNASGGAMVPLSAVAEVKRSVGPISVAHYGPLPSVMLSFSLAPGVSVGDAVTAVQQISSEVLPTDIATAFTGSAKAFQAAFHTLPILLLITVILIYIVLAILYENYAYPFTILTALPFAGLGALLALLLFRQELNIFSFVGIILLIGLVKKNGIMMVDFALQMHREQGMDAKTAIIEACRVRFRPIMMTTMAAIFATLPIALGYGAGAETRQPLGIAVVGGLVFSQLLTLYVTPTFYVTMSGVHNYFQRKHPERAPARTQEL